MTSSTTTETRDVVVIGAGPAGTNAAMAARASGADVLIVERESIPRYKLCGGGLMQASLDNLPPDLPVPVRADVRRVSFTHAGRRVRWRASPDRVVLRMVDRLEFDGALVTAARSAGVEVRDATAVLGIDEATDRIRLRTSAGTLLARAVVGADGSAGRCARFVGARFDQVDLGLEHELSLSVAEQREWHDRVHFDWGPIPGSYGWAFPKGDRLTVGVIAARGDGPAARGYLDHLVHDLHLEHAPVLRSGGHLTRCRAYDSPLGRSRMLLAGDAAGLLEPFTREGISYALRSGTLAGRAAAALAAGGDPDSVRSDYTNAVEAGLGQEMRAGRRCLRSYERHPGVFHRLISGTAPGWAAFRALSTGRTSLPRMTRHPAIRALLYVSER